MCLFLLFMISVHVCMCNFPSQILSYLILEETESQLMNAIYTNKKVQA